MPFMLDVLENIGQKSTNAENTQTKLNPEKANDAEYSKSKLPWFSHVLRHSARKWRGLILQCSHAHTSLHTHMYVYNADKSGPMTAWTYCAIEMSSLLIYDTYCYVNYIIMINWNSQPIKRVVQDGKNVWIIKMKTTGSITVRQ